MKYGKSNLKQITVIRTGKLDSNAAVPNGMYPFFTCDPTTLRINTWAYDTEAVLLAGNNASGNYTAKYYKGQFNAYQRTYIIESADKEKLDVRYLAYAMNKELKLLKTMSAGSTTKFLKIGMLHGLEISLPDISIQRKIASILGNYDDLIDNNKKQIKLLEEAAQRLYKEWFVDLHFPVYEDVDIVDGVPEGWKKERLVDIANVQYGYAFDGSQFNDSGNGMPIIRIRNIPSGNTSDYTTEDADVKYIISNGEILVGMDGEFHINSWSGDNAYLVQRSCCFRPKKKEMNGWLLWAINEPIKYYEKTVVGATVSHLGKKHIDAIELLTGPEELYIPFQKYFDMRQHLLNQNWLLAEARDRLLPKLMSGEIEV